MKIQTFSKNKLKTFKQPSYFTMKPIGLWTSGLYGNSENNIYWTNWLVREMPEWADPKKTNYYMIKIDYNKLYIINNKEDYNNFNKKFISTDGKYIDWKKVQDNNYFGIHISKPFSLFNMSKFDSDINWTYTWDCTSTCIWNKNAILEVIKISIDDLFKNDTKKVISEKLIGGNPIIHVLSDTNPDGTFTAITGDLEDVYFSKIFANA